MADSSLGVSKPLAPALYLSSVYALPDLEALDRISEGLEPGYIYARDAHPNAVDLGDAIARLEDAAWGLVCGSGMAAISLAVLGLVSAGDRIIASNRLYGRTAALLRQEMARFGVMTTFVDVTDIDQVRAAFSESARLLLMETISNPLLRLADISSLAALAHEHDARLLVDNTIATPVMCKPLALGADLAMESLTKMIGGHSDLTLGALCGRDPKLLATLKQVETIWGLSSNPFDCWLAQRGLATLDLRMRAATANAAAVADWLAGQPRVGRVIYPGRMEHPDHELCRRMLPAGAGNMLSFELSGNARVAVNSFLRRATGIPFSPSLGGANTTCSHPSTTSHRYESQAEKTRQGIGEGLLRLSIGIEPLEQIKEELTKGLTS
jgi:cystathionine beta-lyase/cystathionine gamma-synthase